MREAWTDRRLDGLEHKVDRVEQKVSDLEIRVDERFDRVDQRFNEVDSHLGRIERTIDNRLGGLEDRFAAYQRAMLQMSGVIVAALIGIIATQV